MFILHYFLNGFKINHLQLKQNLLPSNFHNFLDL